MVPTSLNNIHNGEIKAGYTSCESYSTTTVEIYFEYCKVIKHTTIIINVGL